MKKLWLLTTLLLCSVLFTGCDKPEPEIIDDCIIPEDCNNEETDQEFISYYDDWSIRETWKYSNWLKRWTWITYDEWWNIINIEEYVNWVLVEDELEENIISIDEENILSTKELKEACLKSIKEIDPENPIVTRNEEKQFINTYWFKWILKSDWLHDWSPTYCNITLNWLVISAWFFRDQWQTIEQLHSEMDFNNVWWIGNYYPNLKEYYWFIWNIVLWDIYQSTYLTWKSTLYFDNYRWRALKLWEEFDWWLIREIDTDEDYPHSEIIFLVKDEENTKNRTWIDWFREVLAVKAISKQILEDFKITLDFKESIIWENNEFIFVKSWPDPENSYYKGITIFDVEESL